MIRVENVSFSYPGTPVFTNISLTLPNTGLVLLTGPSGCGKTTFLRLLAGLETPASGQILRSEAEKVSFAFQEPRLFPWMNVRRNIESVSGVCADKFLREVRLSDAAAKYPDELSGGMQKRVALARALAYESELLLLDEPFAGLDPALHTHILSVIRRYATKHLVLVISHDDEQTAADGYLRFSVPPNSGLRLSNRPDQPNE